MPTMNITPARSSHIRRYLRLLGVPLLAAGLAMPAAHAEQVPPASLTPQAVWPQDTTQIKLTLDVVNILREKHFRKVTLDDSFSSELLDNYLKSLDPSRQIFLASDIAEFGRYRSSFDEALRKGQLEAARTIYQRYYTRLTGQLNRAVQQVPVLLATPLADQNAVVEIDRKKKPWPVDEADANRIWDANIRDAILGLQLSDKQPENIETTLTRRYRNQLNRLNKMTPIDHFEVFINAFTEMYDPHTNYMAPKSSESFDISMTLSLEGIGAVLEREDDFTKVTRLIPGGPAARQAQLKPGDKILAIAQGQNGEQWEDVVGWRLDEVVELIRGQAKTWVRLQVKSSDGDIHNIAILREKVKLEDQAASKKVIELPGEGQKKYRIGIINVPSFYLDFEAMRRQDPDARSTTRDVLVLLRELEKEQIDGLIIDLRDNGGGSLLEANQLTDLFIDEGPVVQILDSDMNINQQNQAVNPLLYGGPLVVLVNHLSASASEIFAGAIQDYRRGIIVGDQTFGKGTVQTLLPLYVGKLKITEAKFYRVSGDSTQNRGVIPDINYPSIIPTDEVGESALDHALPWDAISAAPHIVYPLSPTVVPLLKKQHEQRMKTSIQYQALLDQITFAEAQRKRESLPLDKEKRLEMKKNDEQKLLGIVNTVRQSEGKPAFSKISELEDDNRRKRDEKNPQDDFLLMETGRLLADYIGTTERAAPMAASRE